MAESKLVEKLNNDLLACGICLDRYNQPRGLPCLHCFCHDCLERYCRGQKQVMCPNCKKPTAVPKEGVSGFPPHFIINTLQDMLNKPKEAIQDAICGNCNLKKATSYCLECKEFFCKTCNTAHGTLKANKEHKIVSVEDLSSGKVMLPVTTSEDQMCKDHEGETKKFYCETCWKLICRDCIVLGHSKHQYISLKDASEKQVAKLKDLSRGSENLKKQCRGAIKKTENVEKTLAASSKDVKENLERLKNEYHKQVDAMFKRHKVRTSLVEAQNARELGYIKENLHATLAKLGSACDLATRVTQTGSDYDVTSVFPTLSASLKEMNRMTKPVAASESLAYVELIAPERVDIPDLLSVLSIKPGDKWVQTGQLNTKPGLRSPYGIAVNKDGDIAVTNGAFTSCKVYSKDGKVKCSFSGAFDAAVHDIAITADNKYILSGRGEILFFDSEGNRLNYPKVPTYDMSKKPQKPIALTVGSNGRIVAGLEGTTISTFHGNGQFISKFEVPSQPRWLAVTAKGDIAVSFNIDRTLQLMDYSGNNVRVVQPPQEVTEWSPYSVCCSKQGEIFVVNGGKPKGIYRYTANGEQCLGCIITGLTNNPAGLAISDDGQHLLQVDWVDCVVTIYQRKSAIRSRMGSICHEDIPKKITCF
ncbi:tripartite motif-containing protein 2-like [Amphiura filiformis]|uniref:tripartite motif-containing protein 2-like n=1 Tax=Amphiura filiformis TaxID=82378 RepID=UPI003B20C7C8